MPIKDVGPLYENKDTINISKIGPYGTFVKFTTEFPTDFPIGPESPWNVIQENLDKFTLYASDDLFKENLTQLDTLKALSRMVQYAKKCIEFQANELLAIEK